MSVCVGTRVCVCVCFCASCAFVFVCVWVGVWVRAYVCMLVGLGVVCVAWCAFVHCVPLVDDTHDVCVVCVCVCVMFACVFDLLVLPAILIGLKRTAVYQQPLRPIIKPDI